MFWELLYAAYDYKLPLDAILQDLRIIVSICCNFAEFLHTKCYLMQWLSKYSLIFLLSQFFMFWLSWSLTFKVAYGTLNDFLSLVIWKQLQGIFTRAFFISNIHEMSKKGFSLSFIWAPRSVSIGLYFPTKVTSRHLIRFADLIYFFFAENRSFPAIIFYRCTCFKTEQSWSKSWVITSSIWVHLNSLWSTIECWITYA